MSNQKGRLARAPSRYPIVGRPHAHPRKTPAHEPLGALAPGDFGPRGLRGEGLEAQGRGRVSGQPGPGARAAFSPRGRLLPAGWLGEDHHVLGDTEQVVPAAFFQARAQCRAHSVARVTEHHAAGKNLLGADLLE